MDFGFSSEQKSLAEVVGQVLAKFPRLASPDHDHQVDSAVWRELAKVGLFTLLVPETHGGMGLTLVDVALAIERLGGGLASILIAHTLAATDLIARFATADQKDRLLPALAAGTLRVALATHEVGRSTGNAICDAAIDNGILTGRKMIVAGAASADWFLVLVKSGGAHVLALVANWTKGVSLHDQESLDPSCHFSEVVFDDVACADGDVLVLSEGQAATTRLFNVAAAIYAALQTGLAARMLDTTVQYARTRIQFGQPIGAFQAIKHRCADLAVALDAGQSAAYYACWALSENAPDDGRACSMAKAFCGEVARNACNDAIQIHGGMGFTWDLGLHRFLRRAKILEQGFGNQEWHYEKVMSATLAARAGMGNG